MADQPPLILLLEQQVESLASDIVDAINAIDGLQIAGPGAARANRSDLFFNGLAFEVRTGDALPEWRNYKTIFCNPDWPDLGGAVSLSLGNHIEGGHQSPAIILQLLELAVSLGKQLECRAAIWNPARIVSGFSYFEESVAGYQGGGAFPVLSLVDFLVDERGGLQSTGLDWLAGQEISIAPCHLNQMEMMRRAVRISHDIATTGSIDGEIEIQGLEAGEYLKLAPAAQLKTLEISIYSKSEQ